MNYPPPTSPTPASARNRRTGRTSGGITAARNPRSGRSANRAAVRRKAATKRKNATARKKGSALGLTWWQGLILAMMLVAILLISSSYRQAQDSMTALEKQRQEAYDKYQREVRSYQVKYRDEITYYAAVNRIDPAYVAAIIKRESDYDPRAVSRVGAMGLMQFMPDTFSWVAPNCGISKSNTEAVYEPENAIKMGCYLLKYISDMYDGDPILVACAYHAGWGNVNSWLKNYSTDGKHLTLAQIPMDDTRYYAGKVLNAYAIYQQYYY